MDLGCGELTKERSDAWGAALGDETRWLLYDELRAMPWPAVPGELEKRGIDKPSRAGWYRFLARMRKADAARRIDRIAQSVAEAQAVADRHGIKAAVFVETLKSLAIDRALGGNDKAATSLAAAAASIWANAQRETELELKAAAQQTKDEQLKLAREKFEEEAARRTAAEARAEKAEAEAEALKATIKELEKALQDAGKVNVADPARVAAEVDRILGRKPQQ